MIPRRRIIQTEPRPCIAVAGLRFFYTCDPAGRAVEHKLEVIGTLGRKQCAQCGCSEPDWLASCPNTAVTPAEVKAIRALKQASRRSMAVRPTIEEYNLHIAK